MERLPVEIIHMIFQSFHQLEKVETMLVCRSWKTMIENTVLWTTIRLCSSEQLSKVITNTSLEPSKNGKVERLIIDAAHLVPSELDILSFLFSNIREVIFHQSFDIRKLQFTTLLSPHPWRKTIKVIRESVSHTFTDLILKGDVCPNLTEIQVNGAREKSTEPLIKLLANAPNLRILTLKNYNFTLMELETLHNNVPLLETFTLFNSKINSDVVPEETKPANYMKNLTLEKVHTLSTEKYVTFQTYLTQKYPRIIELQYDVLVDSNYDKDICINSGLALQIQQIGPYLKFLYLKKIDYFPDIFPMLDKSDCKINEFAIMTSLKKDGLQLITQSKQAQYIEHLSLWNIFNSSITKDLTKLTKLTSLSLLYDSNGASVNLSDLMKTIGGNLETLDFGNCSIEINATSIRPVRLYPKLKTLMFNKNKLSPGTDFFISKAFPNLLKFGLMECAWATRTFYIDTLILSRLRISIQTPATDIRPLLIITIGNNMKRWYLARRRSKANLDSIGEPCALPVLRSVPFDKYDGMPFLTLVCNSVQDVVLVNTEV